MPGRTLTVVVLVVSGCFFWSSRTLAADLSIDEREHRAQKVEVVRPNDSGEGKDGEAVIGRVDELEGAIEEERRKSELLKMKLEILGEQVRAEREKIERKNQLQPQSFRFFKKGRRDNNIEQGVSQAGEPGEASVVIREYIWVPEHLENGETVEGRYQLKMR